MAAWLNRINNERVGWFYIDTPSDVDLLPDLTSNGKGSLATVSGCAMGSIAEIISADEAGYYYQLNGQNQWIKKKKSGGGGGGDTPDYDWATEQDVDNLFP